MNGALLSRFTDMRCIRVRSAGQLRRLLTCDRTVRARVWPFREITKTMIRGRQGRFLRMVDQARGVVSVLNGNVESLVVRCRVARGQAICVARVDLGGTDTELAHDLTVSITDVAAHSIAAGARVRTMQGWVGS